MPPLTLSTNTTKDTIQSPSWEQVLSAFHKMNGEDETRISLESGEGASLLVGGGNEGRYIVICFTPNTSYTLADVSRTEPNQTLVIEGAVSGPFPAKYCVDQKLVEQALKFFYEHSEMSASLTWEEEN